MYNEYLILNEGTIFNFSGDIFNVHKINNRGTIENQGFISNGEGNVINNQGTINNKEGSIENNGFIYGNKIINR